MQEFESAKSYFFIMHALDQVLKNAVLFAGTFLGMMLVVSGVSICVMDKTL